MHYLEFKIKRSLSKPYGCCVSLMNGKFIMNMECQFMSPSSSRRNIAFSMEVGMSSGKLMCSISPKREESVEHNSCFLD